MIKVAFVRGKYLNNFEAQNYIFPKNRILIEGFSSKKPIHDKLPFKVNKLSSLVDLPAEKLVKVLSNRIIGDAQNLKGLENYAKQFDIFHSADPHYFYSYQLAKLRKDSKIKKLILTSWETIPFNNESARQKKRIKNFSKKYADLFICYANKAKECLIKEGVNKKKIVVVKLGVDLKRFKPKNARNKKVRILFVGRNVPEKGLGDLKEALKNIKSSKYELKVATNVNYEKIHKTYQESDIFVMPSKTNKTWEEQYGMVLIEAMASGLPVVAYKTGAIEENLGNAGFLVKEGDIDELRKRIEQLINNSELRKKLGKISRIRAEKFFDSRKTSQQILKIYESLSDSTNKKRRKKH